MFGPEETAHRLTQIDTDAADKTLYMRDLRAPKALLVGSEPWVRSAPARTTVQVAGKAYRFGLRHTQTQRRSWLNRSAPFCRLPSSWVRFGARGHHCQLRASGLATRDGVAPRTYSRGKERCGEGSLSRAARCSEARPRSYFVALNTRTCSRYRFGRWETEQAKRIENE